MDRKRQKLFPEKNDVQKECQDIKAETLERKLMHTENKLKLVTDKLEQVKEENCEMKSKIEKYKKQYAELQSENEKLQSKNEKLQSENEKLQSENEKLQSENERLQKYLQDLESADITVGEKSKINLYNTDLSSQITKVTAKLEQLEQEQAHDKLNFEVEKYELVSKIDRYKEQLIEFQRENERLQNYLQDLQSANINLEESDKTVENLNSDRLSSSCTSESDLDESNSDDNMVEESNDDAFDINSLPEEIILRIFGDLNQNELGRIGRVCRTWNKLTRSPTLWKEVNVNFHYSHESQNTVTRCFINILPACVSCIRLNFKRIRGVWPEQLNFEEICVMLQRRCPHLKTLVFMGAILSNTLPSIIDLCTQYLQDVNTLAFCHSTFFYSHLTANAGSCSKIEILEISDCDCIIDYSDADYFYFNNKPPFSRMPHLKQLYLFESFADDSWFEDDVSFLNQLHVLNLGCTHVTFRTFLTLQNHALNLKKLYLCEVDLQKPEVHFSNSAFPHLETICIRDSLVRCESIISFIQSYQSLKNVYLNEYMAETVAAHPYVVANRYMSEIVKGIEGNHNHNVDY